MPKPVKIQLALQGGGAKLVALLAALEAVAKQEKAGKIQVTRIAGTSAGAIAGSLFASLPKANRIEGIQRLRDELLGLRGQRIAEKLSMPANLKIAWDSYRGNIIWKEGNAEIYKWLKENLQAKTFLDLRQPNNDPANGIDLQIVSTELSSKRIKLYTPDESVLIAVMDSCALPFLFCTWRQGNAVVVDGGFCENLPVNELNLNVANDGVVVAVAFNRQAPTPPNDITSFALALLDASIAHSVQCAREVAQSGGYIIELEPEIETFNFYDAFNPTYRSKYNELYDKALRQLEEINVKQFQGEAERERQKLSSNYWTDANKHLIDTMERVGIMYERIFKNKPFCYHRVIFEVWANRWKDPSQPCRVRLRTTFSPADSDIECTATQFSVFSASDKPIITRLELRDDAGNPVQMIPVPMRCTGSSLRSIAIFYDPPLKLGSGPYTEIYNDSPYFNPEDLRNITYTCDRPKGAVQRIELILYVPIVKPGVELAHEETTPPGRKMTGQELDSYKNDPNYYVVGWLGTNVLLEPDGRFGANILEPVVN